MELCESGGDSFVVVTANGNTISTPSDTATVTQNLAGATQLVGLGTGNGTPLDASLASATAYDLLTLVGSNSNASSSVNNSDFVGMVGTAHFALSSLTGPYVTLTDGSNTVKYVAVWVQAGSLGAQWVLYSVSNGTVGVPQTATISGTYTLQAHNDPAITGSASVTY